MLSDLTVSEFLFAFWLMVGLLAAVLISVFIFGRLHTLRLGDAAKEHRWLIILVCILTVALCVLPMNLSPYYNGEVPNHRNQYEETADAFLHGHLYLDETPDPALSELENPYDYNLRNASGIPFAWDHAYYNNHYYMYFGVVPVLLLFLPFKAIFSVSLVTYHATQIFAAFFVIGIFALFRRLSRYFFSDMSLFMYLLLSAAFSVMSLWYGVAAPALYCTAIISAMCMAVWSLFFFVSAVWGDYSENKAILLAALGALFGALEFGCRPTVAISNLLVIPMLVVFLSKRKWDLRLGVKLALAALPYVVIGALLMAYNYARFDNVFEFGQSYQLTLVDMSSGSMLSKFSVDRILENFAYYLFSVRDTSDIVTWGIFITFPILFLPFIGFIFPQIRASLKEHKLRLFIAFILLTAVLIPLSDVLFSELLIPRYRMDFYWVFGIFAFMMIGLWYHNSDRKVRFSKAVCVLAVLTIAMSVALFLTPHDANYTQAFGMTPSAMIENIRSYLTSHAA